MSLEQKRTLRGEAHRLNPGTVNQRQNLIEHPIYSCLDSLAKVRVFMEHHVFAVWDFMSLLKRLQRDLTCVSLPWQPAKNAAHARLINDIVIAEESDETEEGGHISHFELYLQAMEQVGAKTQKIQMFLGALRDGATVAQGLDRAEVPACVARFVSSTMNTVELGHTVEVASSFFHGREDVIPAMFDALLLALPQERTSHLRYYLKRHVEIDGDTHGPLAARLLVDLCNEKDGLRELSESAQLRALEDRIALWDGVVAAVSAL